MIEKRCPWKKKILNFERKNLIFEKNVIFEKKGESFQLMLLPEHTWATSTNFSTFGEEDYYLLYTDSKPLL